MSKLHEKSKKKKSLPHSGLQLKGSFSRITVTVLVWKEYGFIDRGIIFISRMISLTTGHFSQLRILFIMIKTRKLNVLCYSLKINHKSATKVYYLL